MKNSNYHKNNKTPPIAMYLCICLLICNNAAVFASKLSYMPASTSIQQNVFLVPANEMQPTSLRDNEAIQYLQESLLILISYMPDSEMSPLMAKTRLGELEQDFKLKRQVALWLIARINALLKQMQPGYLKFTDEAIAKNQQQFTSLKESIETYKANDIVTNFFTNLFDLFNYVNTSEYLKRTKKEEYIAQRNKLFQTVEKHPYIVPTDNTKLMQELIQAKDDAKISRYQINLFLLRIIMAPLDKPWSKDMSDCFKLLLAFVEKLPDTSALKISHLNLLLILKDLSSEDGIKHIDNAFDLDCLLSMLPPANQVVLMEQKLSIEHITTLATSFWSTRQMCRWLSQSKRVELIEALDTEHLKEMISSNSDSNSLFCLFSDSDRVKLLKRLGII